MRQRALIVGASSAIGAAIAADVATLGYAVVLWGRHERRLEEVAERCRAVGADATTTRMDLSDAAAVRKATADAASDDLSLVVWAAGVFDWAPADEADVAVWENLFQVNLVAAASITRLVLPALIRAAPSALVFIGSGAARQAFANNAAYVASKHGLAGLAGGAFLDVRDRGVKVSLINPGLVSSGSGLQSPAGQAAPESLLTPEDVAAAVRFVLTFPKTGCPTEIVLQPQSPSG